MKIDGKAITEKMLNDLSVEVGILKEKGITPTMVVVLVGDNPASLSYIKQKTIAAEKIGATLILKNQESGIRNQELKELIDHYNNDPSVHGIIIQRPLSEELALVNQFIEPKKDIDGFLPNSPFDVPVANAVLTILNFIRSHLANAKERPLEKQKIVVIGRGETAGKPIADLLMKKDWNVTLVHSKTESPDEIIKKADIVISCVGKPNVVRRDNIKPGAVLLSVGIWRDSEGKLHGDYDEDAIADIANFYTPTPGGVGPVNVACLMQNLVLAAQYSH